MNWFKRVDWHESAQEWAQIAKDAMALEARTAKTRDDFFRLYNVYKDRVSVLEAERDQLQSELAQVRGELEVEQRLTEDMWKYAASDLDIRKARDITSLDDWRKKVK